MTLQSQKPFKNILNDTNGNNFKWATRFITFINAYDSDSHPALKPNEIKQILMQSEDLHILLKEVPKSQINEIINEMASSFSLPVVRWLGYVLIKILSKILSNFYINEWKLIQIKSGLGSNPVILLPSHRSYADFILMAFICFKYNIQLPYVAAGMDFHSMKFMGEILRKCKAFFMRRKFMDDKVYRTIFLKYFQLLMQLGESPIEFFIEGTRSRTCKTLAPKYGLIAMVIDAFRNGLVPDVTLIPISISYDRVLEERLFAYELLGIPKPKESTTGMFSAFKNLDSNYGNIYFNFGQPFNLREWIKPYQQKAEEPNYITTLVHTLAHVIVQKQTELQILSVFNLLAVALSNTMRITGTWTISVDKAVEELNMLCEIIKARKGSVHIEGNLKQAIVSSCNVHSSLVKMNDNNITFINTYNVSSTLQQDSNLINEIVPIVMLQLYINPFLHLIVPPVLFLYAIESSQVVCKGSVPNAFHYLCQVFKLEFVSLTNINNQDMFNDTLAFLRRTACIAPDSLDFGPNLKLRNLLRHHFYPFTSGYISMAHLMAELPMNNNTKWTENAVMTRAQEFVKSMIAKGLLHPYCLTRDLLKNALDSFVLQKYVKKQKIDSDVIYIPERKPLYDLIKFLHFSSTVNNKRSGPNTNKCRM